MQNQSRTMTIRNERVRRRVRGVLISAAFSLGFVAGPPCPSAELPSKTYEIGPQPVSTALRVFALQSDMQLIFTESDVGQRDTRGVNGHLPPQVALAMLLEGTDLTSQITANNVAVVSKDAQEGGGQAVSASSAAADPTVDEVLVTAQKRVESIIDVPISVTVVSGPELEALRVQSTEDFVFNIPNMTFTDFGLTDGVQVSIRGVSQFEGRFDPIGVTVDDVSYGAVDSSFILSTRVLDYERIEVVRGPQGTLSGRGAMGGTVNITTAKPDPSGYELKGTLDVSRFDTTLAKGVINIPVSDTFALRTVAYSEKSDGAMRNRGPGGGSSSLDNFGGRVAARWLASSALTLDAAFAYEDLNAGFQNFFPRDVYFTEVLPTQRDDRIAQLAALGGDYFSQQFIDEAGNNGGVVNRDLPEANDATHQIGSLKATYEMGRHELSLSFGHFEREATSMLDSDRSEYAVQAGRLFNSNTADSFELKVLSNYGGRVDWVMGLSYLDETAENGYVFRSGNSAFGGRYTGTGTAAAFQTRDQVSLESLGAYGNVFWDLGDRWHLSTGVRVTRDKSSYGGTTDLVSEWEVAQVPDANLLKGSDTTVSPRVAVNFDISQQVSAYASWATGYRPGFANNARAVEVGVAPAEVESESVENYELGIKGLLLDGRARFSTAVFHMDYTKLQIPTTVILDGVEYGFSDNSSEATIEGAEVEFGIKPVDTLELSAGIGYVDAKVPRILWYGQDLTDAVIPNTKPWTANFAGVYTKPLSDEMTIQFRADYRYQGESYEDFSRNDADLSSRRSTLDLSAGVITGRYMVTAYFENVFDDTWWLANGTGASLYGTHVGFIPRTFGIRASMNLGE